jgi:hypothetical protein
MFSRSGAVHSRGSRAELQCVVSAVRLLLTSLQRTVPVNVSVQASVCYIFRRSVWPLAGWNVHLVALCSWCMRVMCAGW